MVGSDVIISKQEERGLKSIFIRDEILQDVGIKTEKDVMMRVSDNPAGILLYSKSAVDKWIEIHEQKKET